VNLKSTEESGNSEMIPLVQAPISKNFPYVSPSRTLQQVLENLSRKNIG